MVNLGKRIKNIREKIGLNQADFAERVGLKSATVVSRYEKNQREPDINTLINIANLVNYNLNWLLTGEGSMERETGGGYLYNNVSDVTKLIVQVLQEMPEEAQRDILKHVEEKKLLRELMKERKNKKSG